VGSFMFSMLFAGVVKTLGMANALSGSLSLETTFLTCQVHSRFWWRDTKLNELPSYPVPASPTEVDYQFPYPTIFRPVPSYHPLPFDYLLTTVIPAVYECSSLEVRLPSPSIKQVADGMDIESVCTHDTRTVRFGSDGILLYFAEAAYEPGTSPLSLWVPIQISNALPGENLNYMNNFIS
jgi:snurportin-1